MNIILRILFITYCVVGTWYVAHQLAELIYDYLTE